MTFSPRLGRAQLEADKNFHLSTAPLDVYFHLPKKTIYFPQEITPEAFAVLFTKEPSNFILQLSRGHDFLGVV